MKKLILIILILGISKNLYAGIVAEVIACESGGEGQKGMYAVACVISNRAKIKHKTAKQVVLRRKQFSCLTQQSKATRLKLYLQNKDYADYLETMIMQDKLKDITAGATHYFNPKLCSPYWAKGKKTIKIGNHLFLTLKYF